MWSRFIKSIKREFLREKQNLTAEMCEEIDRLGLERGSVQWVVDQEGLELGRYFFAQRAKEAKLFDLWYPRVVEFATLKRSQWPLSLNGALGPIDAATLRILETKIQNAERVPCRGNFTAAFFSAPPHVLPLVASLWPSNYRHPIFLTADELAEWQMRYRSEEPDQESSWFVLQDWNAQVNPSADSDWFRHAPLQVPDGLTPVLVTWGLCWGSLAGGQKVELWGIDPDGGEKLIQFLCDVTY